jgi:plastocyanin
MLSKNNALFVAGVCGLVIPLTNPVAKAQTKQEERAKICAKAEKRYHKLFGKSPKDEDVTIVMMHKYTFCPPQVTVKQGMSVRWVNVDKRTSHSVWFKEQGKDESGRLFGEEKTEMKFDLPPGKYPYLCGPHWKQEGMIGTVTVVP